MFTLGIPLKIQNLDHEFNEEIIRKIFQRFGTIMNVQIIKSQERIRRHAIVNLSSPLDAAKAVACLNGKVLYKNKLHVTLLTERKRCRKASTPTLQKLGQMAFVSKLLLLDLFPGWFFSLIFLFSIFIFIL